VISDTDESTRTGHVVDPVETLAALRGVPDVQDAVVTESAGTDGTTMLLGYVTGPDPVLGTIPIRQYLTGQLPDYLIPEHLFVLDELPLTPEGDYDLSALPEPDENSGFADSYVAPRNEMEEQLAAAMKDLLPVARVGIHDNFFALGGSSFMATRLTTRIREMYDIEVLLRDVFAAPTVDELGQLIRIHFNRTETEQRAYRRQRRKEKAVRYVAGHPALIWVLRRARRLLPGPRQRA
jgi:acyl carrier protein